ncbi:hypothetical protein JMN32_04820 [Fulvivirga sp. 29W222]|uniref:Uncharacterized protein n=1 Tax=Fulvivirga marina TaxID=2494733 RepID=A0A937FTP2_9BACT|nr:hypothetical protein [Fulvivirga marina]MBL6445619.1 hypothetical protein [Fulvivirga marina]
MLFQVPNSEVMAKIAFTAISSASGSNLMGKPTVTNRGEEQVKFDINVENAKLGKYTIHIHEK